MLDKSNKNDLEKSESAVNKVVLLLKHDLGWWYDLIHLGIKLDPKTDSFLWFDILICF